MEPKPDSKRKRELYLEAIRIQDPDVRQRFLDERCARDSQLRSDLVKLLNANAPQVANPLGDAVSSETNLSTPEAMGIHRESFAVEESIDVSNHPMIGRYKLLEQIGYGGMGTVYMAQQSEPVQRKVALKVIKPGMDTREVIARFEAERQALALMDHPNIARVLDGGSTDEGRPYVAMELVRGVPITQFCEQKNMSLRERLELFVDVCKAVQHAHPKGIIHRDLKPSNIMVMLRDGVPVVKVIDFGVAKALSQQLTEKTLYTHYSQVVGTPLYMAPEQAEMSCLDVDTRSDIYSLGVVLYELLTGTTPFDRETLSSLGINGIRKLLQDQEPPRPSVRVSTLRQAQQSTIEDKRKLDNEDISNQLKRELDWIVVKALEKDRERRYETANAFAADVQRYLNDEPVKACPPTVSYRLRKYIRKHKAWLTTAALLILMMVTSTAVSGVFAYQANEARITSEKSESDAKNAQGEAETEKEKAVAAQKQSDENFAAALEAIDKLLEHASSPALKEISGAQAVRNEMMDDRLDFHKQFVLTVGDSPKIRLRAGSTWYVIAELAKELGETKKAADAYEQATELLEDLVVESPNQWEHVHSLMSVQLAKAWFQFHTLELEQCQDTIKLVQDEIRQAESIDAESSKLANFKVSTARLLARCAKAQGNHDEYRKQLKTAYELSEEFSEVVKTGIRRDLNLQLRDLLQHEDFDRASKHVQKSVELARQAFGEQLHRQHELKLAILLYEAADFFESHDTSLAQKYCAEAVEILNELQNKFPNVVSHIHHLKNAVLVQAEIFKDLDRWADAVRAFEKVIEFQIELNGNASALRQAHASFLWHNADDNVLALTKAIERWPEEAEYHRYRGAAYRERGDVEKALADGNRSVELAPDNPGVYAGRAKTYVLMNEFEKAEVDFEHFVTLS